REITLCAAAGADRVAVVGWDHSVSVVDLAAGRVVCAVPTVTVPPNDPVTLYCVALSPDGTRLATGAADKVVRVYDLTQLTANPDRPDDPPEPREMFAGKFRHEGRVNYVAFGPDGRRLASAGADQVARVW